MSKIEVLKELLSCKKELLGCKGELKKEKENNVSLNNLLIEKSNLILSLNNTIIDKDNNIINLHNKLAGIKDPLFDFSAQIGYGSNFLAQTLIRFQPIRYGFVFAQFDFITNFSSLSQAVFAGGIGFRFSLL